MNVLTGQVITKSVLQIKQCVGVCVYEPEMCVYS